MSKLCGQPSWSEASTDHVRSSSGSSTSADHELIHKQLSFYARGGAGCKFAEYVAREPGRYGWRHNVIKGADPATVDHHIAHAIKDPETSTLSLLFPGADTHTGFLALLDNLVLSRFLYREEDLIIGTFRHIHLRVRLPDSSVSWVTGFGPFAFLPRTRQAPCTEFVFRVKSRPNYPPSIQPPPPKGTVHVADLTIGEISKREFEQFWGESFRGTNRVLGHRANAQSAARTTAIVPGTGPNADDHTIPQVTYR